MNRLKCLLAALAVVIACDGCPVGGGDAGPDAGGGGDGGGNSSSSGSSSGDAGRRDGGSRDGGDGGPGCGPDTPGFGEACGDCGYMVCGRGGELTCQDPGKNACDVCGQLDTAGGIVGRTCGSCGMVGCADGGLVTECQGEHPPNACGGCEDFPLLADGDPRGPPDAGCSSCGTGRWSCRASLNDLSCWGGRAESSSCGTCGPCIKYRADMSDLSQGAFVLAGTRAVIEDVGVDQAMGTTPGDTLLLTFEPLLTGPGGLVMEAAIVYLSPTSQHDDSNAFALRELFSAYSFGERGDPVRQYHVYPPLPSYLPGMRYVIIFDGFLGQVVSRGELVAGPPPGP
ncbi:MAG: hypothetical protein HY904_01510 [Deltaproteobacteria bacterium]|nr:hypothetical protein [Deltaproteobacteria bacterium]